MIFKIFSKTQFSHTLKSHKFVLQIYFYTFVMWTKVLLIWDFTTLKLYILIYCNYCLVFFVKFNNYDLDKCCKL